MARAPQSLVAPRPVGLSAGTEEVIEASPRRSRRRGLVTAGCLTIYALLACAVYWPVSPLSDTRLLLCGCYDPAQQVWWISWTPFALLHHLNPFGTNYLNYPAGVNLADNTDPFLLGFLTSPVNYLFGPVAALNLILRLAFFTSAGAAFLLIRRWVSWTPAAFIGGLLFGFGPFMTAEGSLHPTLTFLCFVPLIVWAVDELVVRRRHRPWAVGIVLGLCCAGQFLISSEVLASTIVVVVCALVFLACTHRRAVQERLGRIAIGAGCALATFGAICAYPIYYFFEGPAHLTGPAAPIEAVKTFAADVVSIVVPTTNQLLGPHSWRAYGATFLHGNVTENGVFLGPILLLLLVALWWTARRRAVVQVAAFAAACSLLLVLGPRLQVNGHLLSIPLPGALLLHLPLLADGLPVRYAIELDLAAAILLAAGLDDLVARRPTRPVGEGAGLRTRLASFARSGKGLALGAAALVVVPLLPNVPYYQAPISIPYTYFTTKLVDRVPPGSVVLAYPYPTEPQNQAMIWQTESRMRFRLLGGYAVTGLPNGQLTGQAVGLEPSIVQTLFYDAMNGVPSGQTFPPFDEPTFAALREFAQRYDVDTILVNGVEGKRPHLLIEYLKAAFGRTRRTLTVYGWYGLQTRLAGGSEKG